MPAQHRFFFPHAPWGEFIQFRLGREMQVEQSVDGGIEKHATSVMFEGVEGDVIPTEVRKD